MASIPISIMISTMTPILISIPGWGFAGIICPKSQALAVPWQAQAAHSSAPATLRGLDVTASAGAVFSSQAEPSRAELSSGGPKGPAEILN